MLRSAIPSLEFYALVSSPLTSENLAMRLKKLLIKKDNRSGCKKHTALQNADAFNKDFFACLILIQTVSILLNFMLFRPRKRSSVYNSSIKSQKNTMSKNQNTSVKNIPLQSSTSNKVQFSPSSKDISKSKMYYFEQPSISGNSVSTLSTMHLSNTMGSEPHQVIITIDEPRNEEGQEYLKQHLSPQQHRKPHKIDCKQCGKSGISITQTSLGAGSLIICLLFLMAGCLLFAWIPLCLPDCMDVKHYCPNCGAPAGVSRYLLDG